MPEDGGENLVVPSRDLVSSVALEPHDVDKVRVHSEGAGASPAILGIPAFHKEVHQTADRRVVSALCHFSSFFVASPAKLDTVSSKKLNPQTRARILEAALSLIRKRGGADVTMAEIARASRLSRQAVYLHFVDRADLLVALVRHADEKRGLWNEVRKIAEAPTAVAALREMASLQARMNPGIWAVARALDAVRRLDEPAERSWQDRLESRLSGCREIVARLKREGVLRRGLDPGAAADLIWTVTSLRTWEDLVLQRGWTARQYKQRVTEMLLAVLTDPNPGPP